MASSTWKSTRDVAYGLVGRRIAWPHAVNILLGIGLAGAAFTFDPQPTNLYWSDLLSSGLIVLLSALACTGKYSWPAWGVAGVGVWLIFAPIVFWAPTASAYNVGTLVGTLVFTLAAVVPTLAGEHRDSGPEDPPGWSYGPSHWLQRAPIIIFALLQFFIARHMAAFQLGHTSEIWDPIFGNGTQNVLDSDVSKAFPVSDAGLGAVTYLIEALTGFLGGTRRWRTMPWAVVVFGIMIVPVGVVSVVLVVLQPVAVGAWCAWCLLTAAMTVLMIGPALDELIATGQFLLRARHEGQSLWHVFWHGGTIEVRTREDSQQEKQSLGHRLAGGLELLTIPWNLAVCLVLGLWLMMAPVALENAGWSANNDHLVGALIITFAAIGFSEAGRAARLTNILLGAWLLVAPFLLSGGTAASWCNDLAVGAAVILLSLRRGRIEEKFGSWQRWVV